MSNLVVGLTVPLTLLVILWELGVFRSLGTILALLQVIR